MTLSVTITEFFDPQEEIMALYSWWNALVVGGCGTRASGLAVASGSVLNDVTTAITNGKM